MTDEQKRFNKGLIFALGFHIVVAGILGILGISFETTRPPQVLEITLSGGGPAAAVQEEVIEEKIEQVTKEDIVDKKLKPKKEQRQVEKKVIANPNAKPNPNAKVVAEGGTGTGESSEAGGGEGAGSGSGSAQGVPVTPPRIVSSVRPPYPSSARNASIEGTVYVKMLVNASGKVEDAFVSQSSGNAALDESAVNTVYKWRFSPARDTFKEKVSCYITIPVNFRLNR